MLFIAVFSFLFLSCAQSATNQCTTAKNCGECMMKGAECVWCFAPDFNDRSQGPEYRCAPKTLLKERGCPEDKMKFPQNKRKDIRIDEPKETDNKTVQLSPQEVELSLRPNLPYKMKFSFTQAKNYPVDLYHLTDLSYSMNKHLAAVSSQAKLIEKKMSSITKKFRMGFGAFVDKPVFPFIDPREKAMKNPCLDAALTTKTTDCDPPFGYKHVLGLTVDTRKFSEAINNTKPSGNLDGPEGGLDALLQAALCTKHLGWNKNARKIVLYTSDSGFHIAGDGKLGGLVERFEETCAMGKKPDSSLLYYLKSTKLDYPSVGQVARVLEKNGIAVIFAITNPLRPLYENFVKILPSAAVGVLSDNIVDLIKDNYDKISSTVTMNIEGIEDFKYTLKTQCTKNGPFEDVKTCTKLPLGGHIEYELTLEAKKCLKQPRLISLRPANLDEQLILRVTTPCDCPECNKESTLKSAPQCGGHGDLVCGACSCKPDRSGDFCECSTTSTESALVEQCIKKGDSERKLCSGRGRCECGTCKCSAGRYNGTYCECDNMGCPRAADDNTVCGGPSRGRCLCNGTCVCNKGYTRKACDCLESNKQCHTGDTVCSGHGTCDCGMCVCKLGYMGLTCADEQGTEGPLCNEEAVKKCVPCLHEKETSEKGSLDCEEKCKDANYIDLKDVKMVEDRNNEDGSRLCIVYDSRECRIYFTYRWEDRVSSNRKAKLRIQRASECPAKVNVFAIVGGVIAGIVLIGLLLLLIWKTVVTISDKQEVAKFQKELDNAKWEMEENPIFKEPVTTVNNPLYSAHGE